jgi:cation transport regulator
MRRPFFARPSITPHSAHAHDPRREEAAFRIAWAAVKREYEKAGDEWVAKR